MKRVLEQVALSPGLERTENVHIALVRRQHDHSCLGELRSNGDEGIEPVHFRHLNVHQRYVWTVRPELLDSVTTVGGFCDQRHIRLNPNETGDSLSDDWMVVDRENPNSRAVAARHTSPPVVCGRLADDRRDHQERLPDVA